MKRYLTLLLFLLSAMRPFAQTVQRMANEDAGAFVSRLIPEGAMLAHHVIETNRWSYPGKMIIACFGNDTPVIEYNNNKSPGENSEVTGKFSRIDGHVYIPTGKNTYRDITFGPIEEDGDYIQILSVFFANADKDTTKEMIVLCSFETKNYDFEGTVYRTFIYGKPRDRENTAQLTCLESLSQMFYGMEGTWRDGTTNRAKYKTAKDIRLKLKQMGY